MFLCDKDIKKSVESWTITISDFDENRLNPASYDILLGNKFLIVDSHTTLYIDPEKKIFPKYNEKIVEDSDYFVLHPGTTILWVSRDMFWSNNYLIQLWWKSSLARLWLIVHNTAWLINPGHFLNITFELANLNKVPIILRPGMRIAQILFSKMTDTPEKDYKKVWNYGEWNKNFTI